MKYFIGVDGGGTKTALALSSADGAPLKTSATTGCSYQSLGAETVVRILEQEIRGLLASGGASAEDCAGCCIGLPCYGENPDMDQVISDSLTKRLAPIPVLVVNDAEVGWAGSLECRAGIHVVAGTGAIAFGRGANGASARCGGWNEFYGDEGSCYWVGRQAMSLFSKEADGRAPRGALYEIVREKFGLLNDFYFTDVILERWAPFRAEVAAFQNCACEAAEAGDAAAASLYREAARELALLVKALREKLFSAKEAASVSYSGGLFKAGALVLQPFRQEVEALGCTLHAPRRSATEGALLLAIQHFA